MIKAQGGIFGSVARSQSLLDAIAAASDHGTTPFPTKAASQGSVR
jgi:hypothetical protein